MDIAEVLGGISLLMIGVLAVVPLLLDGWFIWFPPDPSVTAIVIVTAVFLIILGFYLIVAGFRSEKKSHIREVVGYVCLTFSSLIFFAGLATESETWTTVFLILGFGSLIVGAVLVIRSAPLLGQLDLCFMWNNLLYQTSISKK